ncbi:MAG: hypothetical protein LBJ11_02710 [Oscillospiraceae bacterium]|jgi:serine/threonine-protein kinase|nr:hypothetical protein [Oscillospiraceae bacterium]
MSVTQRIDGVPVPLERPFPLEFLHHFGTVFRSLGNTGSPNLCFGVQNGVKRYFVKFAGAPTIGFRDSADDAIAWLTAAIPIYQACKHPHLIRFLRAEEIGGGVAAVFEWTDALGVGRMYPQSHARFQALPAEKRLRAYRDILWLHAHIAAQGYVAIDFYDGSIMYDFARDAVIVCDIDYYQKSPYTGDMGLLGSTKFVSPEEITPGAVMDEITMVYTMGATAFALFGGFHRARDTWTLSAALYDVAVRAVSSDRARRQQSIQQLIAEWTAAETAFRSL